jgi:RNA polymerase sigma factor (sigma-70 family)
MDTLLTLKKEIKQFSPLTKEEQYNLGLEYQKTKDIKLRDKLIHSNLRYAYNEAARWSSKYPLDDCLSLALEGIVTAIPNWQPDRGAFTTFFKKHMIHIMSNYEHSHANLIRQPYSQRKKEGFVKASVVSTGTTIPGSDDLTLGETLVGDLEINFEINQDSTYIKACIWNEIKKQTQTTGIRNIIDTRAYDIVKGHYNTKELKLSYDEIGACYGVSKQNVSQKEKEIFKHLRNNPVLQDIYKNKMNYLT